LNPTGGHRAGNVVSRTMTPRMLQYRPPPPQSEGIYTYLRSGEVGVDTSRMVHSFEKINFGLKK
jgi:hypothetical protein